MHAQRPWGNDASAYRTLCSPCPVRHLQCDTRMTDYAARKLTEMFVEAEMGQPLPWLMRSRRRCVRCVHRIIAGHSERTHAA
ncbi:hypothetical protein XANMN_02365 [Xanthomonas phaseoli pv. manihotis str. CIO151]|nr:hypothetical protein XANMN_02365 [Xanthomonas phaseoli pv. manihotis str. CIO151]